MILLAGGKGERWGSATPKLMAQVDARPLITLAARTVIGLGFATELVLVVRPALREQVKSAVSQLQPEMDQTGIRFTMCDGGDSRADSVQAGLAHVSTDYVLIHDGSRPFASRELFTRVLAAVAPGIGAVPVIRPTDSLLILDNRETVVEYLDRGAARHVQTPQAFVTSEYRAACELMGGEASGFKDDGSLFVAAGYSLVAVPGEEGNIKITYPHDLSLAQELARQSTEEP